MWSLNACHICGEITALVTVRIRYFALSVKAYFLTIIVSRFGVFEYKPRKLTKLSLYRYNYEPKQPVMEGTTCTFIFSSTPLEWMKLPIATSRWGTKEAKILAKPSHKPARNSLLRTVCNAMLRRCASTHREYFCARKQARDHTAFGSLQVAKLNKLPGTRNSPYWSSGIFFVGRPLWSGDPGGRPCFLGSMCRGSLGSTNGWFRGSRGSNCGCWRGSRGSKPWGADGSNCWNSHSGKTSWGCASENTVYRWVSEASTSLRNLFNGWRWSWFDAQMLVDVDGSCTFRRWCLFGLGSGEGRRLNSQVTVLSTYVKSFIT